MSSAARRAPTDAGGPPPSRATDSDAALAEVPTRVTALADEEVRALFASTEGETGRSVDVSGLELDDVPTRAVPSSAPMRAVSLSDDGIVVPIEVFDPLPETGVRVKAALVPTDPPAPVPESWLARVTRMITRVLRGLR